MCDGNAISDSMHFEENTTSDLMHFFKRYTSDLMYKHWNLGNNMILWYRIVRCLYAEKKNV